MILWIIQCWKYPANNNRVKPIELTYTRTHKCSEQSSLNNQMSMYTSGICIPIISTGRDSLYSFENTFAPLHSCLGNQKNPFLWSMCECHAERERIEKERKRQIHVKINLILCSTSVSSIKSLVYERVFLIIILCLFFGLKNVYIHA